MTLSGDFDQLLSRIESGVMSGSLTASLEEQSDFSAGSACCSVRVFERYGYGGRLSLHVVLFDGGDGQIHLSATASGGSQAMFFKVNTWSEESFLDTLREVLARL